MDPEVQKLEIDRAYAKQGQLSPDLQKMMDEQPESVALQVRMNMCGLGHLVPTRPEARLTQDQKDTQWTLAKRGYNPPGFPTLEELEARDGPRPD